MFYFHSLYVLPYAIVQSIKLIWRLPFALILELLAYVGLAMIADQIISHRRNFADNFDSRLIIASVWRGIYFIMYGTGYYFLKNYLRNKKQIYIEAIEIEQLKNQLLQAERDFLRAQINPHLLFNTLNFIKYAAKKKPECVEEAVLTLSQIIRFSLDENNADYLKLSGELKQINNYIRLNQLRYEERLYLNYHTEIADDTIPIIPIVLLTLVENIFKHGN
ncbi:MAG: sensor histidine kinase, partial [Mucilaginibacter sp.]